MAVNVKFKESLCCFTYSVDRAQLRQDTNYSGSNYFTFLLLEEKCQSILDQWNQLREDRRAQHWSLLRVQKHDFARVKVWLKQSKIPSPACIELLNIIGDSDNKLMHFQLDRFATQVFANIEPNNIKTSLSSLATIKKTTTLYRNCLYNNRRLSRTQWKQFVNAVNTTFQWFTRVRKVNHPMTKKFLKSLLVSLRDDLHEVNNYKFICPWHTTVSDELVSKCDFLYLPQFQ